MMTATASATETTAREYYEENGYYICRNLIPHDMIDRVMERYRKDIVPTRYPFFRQSTNAYEPNRLTEHGYVKQSFLDVHDYQRYPDFSRFARDIYTSLPVRQALKEITGFDSFNLMQTMLFDANTETQPHQDWWYLDSVPNGHLLAGWFAMEDIEERAGRFYVLPRSWRVDLHSDTPNLPHSEWIVRMRKYVDSHPEQVYAPALKKGDVLFWNSRTIHGALPTQDPTFSRKSLTAHYMPAELAYGNLFVKKEAIRYKEYNGMKFYRNQPDYSLANKLKFGIKTAVYNSPAMLAGLRKIQRLITG